MIGRTISHYKILSRIGQGGMSVVYKAEDTRLHRTVALKFLHPQLVGDAGSKKRFLREAQAASSLDHPNICSIYEIDETPDGQLFIAMAYYAGESLKSILADRRLPVRDAFKIAFSTAQGLARAHATGIIHRDIKPANVMITEDGLVKIVDFGLAKLAGRSRVTLSKHTVGTVAYMSPEQAVGETVDGRTDIWALGVMLYEMLTGELPFHGEIDQAIIYSIINQKHKNARQLNPDVPVKLAAIVDRCLEKEIDKRFASVEELIEALAGLRNEMGWHSSLDTLVVPFTRSRRQRRYVHPIAVAFAAVVVAATVWGAWRAWRSRGAPAPYTTNVRVAVMPFEDRTRVTAGPEYEGLAEVTADVLDVMRPFNESMWVVPYHRVVDADLSLPMEAATRFGANRVLLGDAQRHGPGMLLTLTLCEAASLDPLEQATIQFNSNDFGMLCDSLPAQLETLVGFADGATVAGARTLPTGQSAGSYLTGIGLARRDNLDGAIAAFEACLRSDSTFAPVLTKLGYTMFRRGFRNRDESVYPEAEKLLRAGVANDPRSVVANRSLGDFFFFTSRPDSAISFYERVLSLDPGNVTACRRLGRIFERQSRFAEAQSVFRQAIDHRRDYWVAHRSLGLHYYRTDRIEDAIDKFRETLTFAPDDVLTLNNLGMMYHSRGEWSTASRLLERSFQVRPTCETCSNVGLLLYFERRYEESASYYEFALEYCDSTDPEYYLAWGNWASALYWAEGKRQKSLDVYRQAISLARDRLEITPNNPKLLASLIDYYAAVNDTTLAVKMMERADPQLKTDTGLMYSAGSAYEKFGERELALHYIGDAIRHGYPVQDIEGDPILTELISDPRYRQMAREVVLDAAESGGNQP